MITTELKVGDVLRGKTYKVDLLVKGFKDEETINGISKQIILEDMNHTKGAVYIAPLSRIMYSQYDVIRGNEIFECKCKEVD